MPSKPIVYISRKVERSWFNSLGEHCRLVINPKRTSPSPKELIKQTKKADAIIASVNETIGKEIFEANPNLKIVANYAIGYDNIDLKAAKKAKVPVSNAPGDFAGSVSEHTLALMLAASKRLSEGDAFMRANKYKGWDPMFLLGNDLRGQTLGIIGVGRIGSALASICSRGLDMPVLYSDVIQNKKIEDELGAKKVSLKELLQTADFVSIHVPLLPTTRHLIGAKQLGWMKPNAILINTARGPVVDEKALVEALRKKKIAGAGLDVFEFEPKMVPGINKLPNVILTPHTASATYSARRAMAEITSENVLDVLVRGQRPRNEIK